MLSPSDVAGWGAFLHGTAVKDQLLVEYVAELITHAEAEKRGKTYDKQKCSYLFNLNESEWFIVPVCLFCS